MSSRYFIPAGVIVAANKWKISFEILKAFRKKIAREGFLAYDVEFHCAEMIGSTCSKNSYSNKCT